MAEDVAQCTPGRVQARSGASAEHQVAAGFRLAFRLRLFLLLLGLPVLKAREAQPRCL